jgi:hypothetical protein
LNTGILQPITDDSSLQAERRFLRALWPVCRLTGHRIIDSLPPDCMGRAPDAHIALAVLQDSAYRQLSNSFGTKRSGLEALAAFDACNSCIGSPDCWAHPTFQSLRKQQ